MQKTINLDSSTITGIQRQMDAYTRLLQRRIDDARARGENDTARGLESKRDASRDEAGHFNVAVGQFCEDCNNAGRFEVYTRTSGLHILCGTHKNSLVRYCETYSPRIDFMVREVA